MTGNGTGNKKIITPATLLRAAYPKAWPVLRLRLALSWDHMQQRERQQQHALWHVHAADVGTTAREYLQRAFTWCATPEGHDHWAALHASAAGALTAAQLLRNGGAAECGEY